MTTIAKVTLGIAAALVLGLAAVAVPLVGDGTARPGALRQDGAVELRAQRSYGSLPLAFEPNAGRGPASIDFVARSGAGALFLSGGGARIASGEQMFRLDLVGADPVEPSGMSKLPGVVNDLRGDDPSRWITGIPTFERVRYAEVYPGISVDWYGNKGGVEYDFRLAAGADPGDIAVRLGGADELRIAPSGDLLMHADGATVRQRAPIASQPGGGPVPVAFTLDGNVMGFRLGAHDPRLPVVIDPLVVTYSTYLGGDADDTGRAIAVDPTGAAYITGGTDSTDFPTENEFEGDTLGSEDVFVSKLNPEGSALVYSTYLGGNGNDSGMGIAVDSAGRAYVTGQTASTDFDTLNPYEDDADIVDGTFDVFVTKLTANGDGLVYSTYIGGDSLDVGTGIAVDSAGMAYVTGWTLSTDYDTVDAHEADDGAIDAFLSVLNTAGNDLTYSTYLAGEGQDLAQGVAVDSSANAYITGVTGSDDFDLDGEFQTDQPGDDAFVAKFTPGPGDSLVYSTYLGGDLADQGNAIAVDGSGAAHVTGFTGSTDFPEESSIEGDTDPTLDAFVSKLTPAGDDLTYSTYLGGDADDQGKAIAIDSDGGAVVGGTTESTDFDVQDPVQGSPGGGEDGFVSQLTAAGDDLLFSTYVAGSGEDEVNGIAADGSGAVYIAGHSESTDFPTEAPIQGDDDVRDAIVAKLSPPVPPEEPPPPPPVAPVVRRCAGQTATIVGTTAGETLTGTGGPDVIAAGGGDDIVRGLGGLDLLCGQAGNDRMSGGAGIDRLLGWKGRDILKGGPSLDTLRGGRGRDRLIDPTDDDVLRGGPGVDQIIT